VGSVMKGKREEGEGGEGWRGEGRRDGLRGGVGLGGAEGGGSGGGGVEGAVSGGGEGGEEWWGMNAGGGWEERGVKVCQPGEGGGGVWWVKNEWCGLKGNRGGESG